MKSRQDLISMGLLTPKSSDWKVELVFLDDTTRSVRVSPGSITEEQAVERAIVHAKVMDRSILKSAKAQRVEKSLSIAPFGMIQKG
jgi:hypothetical protein|tara:strand:+ start:154 stop:411 length:258 start_codon:yes stop_codon:yes gene_type:complete